MAVSSSTGEVLHWTEPVLSAQSLRHSLNGHREILLPPRAIITPLAHEELRSRGVRIATRLEPKAVTSPVRWGVGQDEPQPLVQTAVQALQRDGLEFQPFPQGHELGGWAKAVAECVARGTCCGGVVFCREPELVCCVANKVPGLRAVAVTTVLQATRATVSVGANLLAVEMPGRTFFEVRQILRTCCSCEQPCCPPGLACTLKELENRATR